MCRKLLGPEAPLSKKIWIESYPSKRNPLDRLGKKKEHIHQLWTLIFRISRRIISLHVWLWSWRAALTFPKTVVGENWSAVNSFWMASGRFLLFTQSPESSKDSNNSFLWPQFFYQTSLLNEKEAEFCLFCVKREKFCWN